MEGSVMQGIGGPDFQNMEGPFHRDGLEPSRVVGGRHEYYYNNQLYMVVFNDGVRYITNTELFRKVSDIK